MQPAQTWVTQYQKPDNGISLAGNILSSYLTGQQKQTELREKKQLQALTLLGNLMQLPKDEREQFIPFVKSTYESVLPNVGGMLGYESPDAKYAREMKEKARGDIQGLTQPTTETTQPLLRQRDITTESRLSPQQGQSLFNLPQQQTSQQAMPQQMPSLPQPYAGGGSYAPISAPSGAVGVPSSIPQVPPAPQQQPMLDFTRPLPPERQETITRQPGTAVTSTIPGLSLVEVMWRNPAQFLLASGVPADKIPLETQYFSAQPKEVQNKLMGIKFNTELSRAEEDAKKRGDLTLTLSIMQYRGKVIESMIQSGDATIAEAEAYNTDAAQLEQELGRPIPRIDVQKVLSTIPPGGTDAVKAEKEQEYRLQQIETQKAAEPTKALSPTAIFKQNQIRAQETFAYAIDHGYSEQDALGMASYVLMNPGVVSGGEEVNAMLVKGAKAQEGTKGFPNSCAVLTNNVAKANGINLAGPPYNIKNTSVVPSYQNVGSLVYNGNSGEGNLGAVQPGDLVFTNFKSYDPQWGKNTWGHIGIADESGAKFYNVSSAQGYTWSLSNIPLDAMVRRLGSDDPYSGVTKKWDSSSPEEKAKWQKIATSPNVQTRLGVTEPKPAYTPQQATQDLVTMKEKKFQMQKYWEAQQAEEIKENSRQNTAYQFADYLKKTTKTQYSTIYDGQIKGKQPPEKAAEYARRTTQTWIDGQIAEQKGIASLLLEYGIPTTVSGLANLPDYTPKKIEKLSPVGYGKTADPEGYALWEKYDEQEKEALKYTPGYVPKEEKIDTAPKPEIISKPPTMQFYEEIIAQGSSKVKEALKDLEDPSKQQKLRNIGVAPEYLREYLKSWLRQNKE